MFYGTKFSYDLKSEGIERRLNEKKRFFDKTSLSNERHIDYVRFLWSEMQVPDHSTPFCL